MPNLTQRATHRVRDTAQTALARAIQMMSQFLGRFTPAVQTRIVRGVQVCVEVHVKSGVDDVSTHAAALTYAAFLSLVPLIMLGLAVTGELEATAASGRELVPGVRRRDPRACAADREPAAGADPERHEPRPGRDRDGAVDRLRR